MDSIMCAMMNAIQWHLRRGAVTREQLERYLDDCSKLDRSSYYALPCESGESTDSKWHRQSNQLTWKSPRQGPHPENNTAQAVIYETDKIRDAPSLILLHSLMSASAIGYRRIAERFNARGWRVIFPHLPYHYSRRPRGHANGSLTITSNLIGNAESLRQSVVELRQLIGWSRRNGSERVAILGTSYGAWVGAITLSLEQTDFSILLQPVTDVGHATFASPASTVMASLLRKNGILREHLDRHAHLSSPLHARPLTAPDRITIIAGTYDRLSPPDTLKTLCKNWGGARYREVAQGHFGYLAMGAALEESELFLDKMSPSDRSEALR